MVHKVLVFGLFCSTLVVVFGYGVCVILVVHVNVVVDY